MLPLPSSGLLVCVALASVISTGVGWTARGWLADSDMASFKDSLAEQSSDQRSLKMKVEAAQTVTTQQSTARLDQQAAQQQKVTVYVDREVVQYRDRWRDRDCPRPAEWVRLYNASLFGVDAGPVPETR